MRYRPRKFRRRQTWRRHRNLRDGSGAAQARSAAPRGNSRRWRRVSRETAPALKASLDSSKTPLGKVIQPDRGVFFLLQRIDNGRINGSDEAWLVMVLGCAPFWS